MSFLFFDNIKGGHGVVDNIIYFIIYFMKMKGLVSELQLLDVITSRNFKMNGSVNRR